MVQFTLVLVRVKGLEPSQPCGHKNLNLTRLPIPPNPHFVKCLMIIACRMPFVKMFFDFFARNCKKIKVSHHALLFPLAKCNDLWYTVFGQTPEKTKGGSL